MRTLIEHTRRIALGAALVSLPVAAIGAQAAAADARWTPWIGCWRADVDTRLGIATTTPPLVCVTPTAVSSAVQIATIDSGKVIARDTVNADDTQRQIAKGGCTGWERAHFSSDANRVYLRSELTCGAGLKRNSTGMLSIAPDGDWLDVQGTTVSSNSAVRATRFHDAKVSVSELPIDIATLVRGQDLATNAARTAAGAPLSSESIVDAVKQLDTAVVQTWIVQRGTHFNFDSRHLVALADAGVPGSVTDVMIGVSYPERFALKQQPARMVGGNELTSLDSARFVSQYLNSRCYGSYDRFWGASSAFDPCSQRYGFTGYDYYSRYGSYGYNPFGYGYGYGSGYVSYAPVVVVKGADNPHGRVVNGHGYTRGSDDGASSGSRSYGPSSSTSTGSSSGGGGGGSSVSTGSSSSGSSSSGGERTAHAKP